MSSIKYFMPISFFWIFSLGLPLFPAVAQGDEINFSKLKHHEITFDGVKPTKYKLDQGRMQAEVTSSASAVIVPFSEVKKVKRASFQWQMQGSVQTTGAPHEETKAGDDLPLRIGFCLSGDAPLVPFFAPSWVKAIAKVMKLPSDRLLYLAVGSKHKPGSKWVSPYSSSMEIFSVEDKQAKKQWRQVQHTFKDELNVVGLWLMADGDNTQSNFQMTLRKLELH